MKLARVHELPLSRTPAGDRIAEAAGKVGWQVRSRHEAELTLWKPGRLSQLQLGITVKATLEPVEAGRTRATLSTNAWRWRHLRRQVIESRLSELSAGVEQRVIDDENVPSQVERWLIRIVMAVLALASLAFTLTIDVPPRDSPPAAKASAVQADASETSSEGKDESREVDSGEDTLPAIALDQPAVYRSEICLGVFYLGLLILVPLYYGVIRGRIPTEISARGARFAADEISGSLDAAEKKIEQLDQRLVSAEIQVALARSNQVGKEEAK